MVSTRPFHDFGLNVRAVFLQRFIARTCRGFIPFLLENLPCGRPEKFLAYFRQAWVERPLSPFPFVPAFLRFRSGLFQGRKGRVFRAGCQLVCMHSVVTFCVAHIDARMKASAVLGLAAVNRRPVIFGPVEYPGATVNAGWFHLLGFLLFGSMHLTSRRW